jgi:hypothetical protein
MLCANAVKALVDHFGPWRSGMAIQPSRVGSEPQRAVPR